jgi:WhiB family redox-sensing transcriptional regulator
MADTTSARALPRQPFAFDWRLAAACRHADPELFFPESSTRSSVGQVAQAKAVCAGCGVRRECLHFAFATRQSHGVWGGTTEEERQTARGGGASGRDPRPDLSRATTPEEFLEELREFRLQAGNPSFRDLARRCNGHPALSTIYRALEGGELPRRFEVIDAILGACGGTKNDREQFETAWSRLVFPERNATACPHVGRINAGTSGAIRRR